MVSSLFTRFRNLLAHREAPNSGGAVETEMTKVGNGSDQAALEMLIIGHSPAAQRLRDMIRRVARSNASVMLCGPSGSVSYTHLTLPTICSV